MTNRLRNRVKNVIMKILREGAKYEKKLFCCLDACFVFSNHVCGLQYKTKCDWKI